MNEQELRRTLDIAAGEGWEAARTALDGLEGETVEELRTFATRMISQRHDLRNAISIAVANLEGMLDGALTVTPTRLQSICKALVRAQGLLR